MELNKGQQAVADSRNHRTLVLAGAGTGKTAASTHWIASLVKEGVPLDRILMLTFTNKAATEMQHRVVKLTNVEKSPGTLKNAGTYHAVSANLMRRNHSGFGLSDSNFTVLDEQDIKSLWNSAIKGAGIDKNSSIGNAAKLDSIVSKAINWCRDPKEMLGEIFFDTHWKKAIQAYENYVSLKESANALDYDDLVSKWLKRLQNDAPFADRLRDWWKYVMVDEFQDNNPLNMKILEILNPQHLLVVGDKNQSIYGFRCADPNLVDKFLKDNSDAVIIKLETNYRSGQEILDLANEVVRHTDFPLVLTSPGSKSSKVIYKNFPSLYAEADGVVDLVKKTKLKSKANQISLLSRSSRSFSLIEIELKRNKIPYKKYGGQTITDSAEVRDFISFLRVLHNSKDKIAWVRALSQFPKMGEAGALKIFQNHTNIADDAWKSASDMRDWLIMLKTMDSLESQLEYLLKKIPVLIKANYKDDCEERVRNLNTIFSNVQGFTLGTLLEAFSTDKLDRGEHPEDSITLSTIHSAKGLEWDNVWFVGVGSKQIPHFRAQTKEEVAEERRLFYVAVTRARSLLILSYADCLDRDYQSASRFCPEDAVWEAEESSAFFNRRF